MTVAGCRSECMNMHPYAMPRPLIWSLVAVALVVAALLEVVR